MDRATVELTEPYTQGASFHNCDLIVPQDGVLDGCTLDNVLMFVRRPDGTLERWKVPALTHGGFPVAPATSGA